MCNCSMGQGALTVSGLREPVTAFFAQLGRPGTHFADEEIARPNKPLTKCGTRRLS